MAVPLSNNFSLYSFSSKPYKSPKPLRTLAILPSHTHSQSHYSRLLVCNNTNYGFSFPDSWSTRSVKSFLAAAAAAAAAEDDDSTVVEPSEEDESLPSDVEVVENDANQKSVSSLKSLLQKYKDVILTGDEKAGSEIENTIFQEEIEKSEQLSKVAAFSSDITAAKERYLRLQADFDNFRKRSEKERLTIRSSAQGEVIESLLPVIDNFERAKQQLKLETEKEKQIDASYQGIYKQFAEIMRSLNVAIVPTVGKPFDPSFHEAIAREESQEFKDGIILQEFRRGFVLGERLLRPAMVKVSAGPGPQSTIDSTELPSTTAAQPAGAGIEK